MAKCVVVSKKPDLSMCTEKRWKVSVGECAKHLTTKEAVRFNKMQTVMGMGGMCLRELTNFEAWSPEEVQL